MSAVLVPTVLGIFLAGVLSAARTALSAVEDQEIRACREEGKTWADRALRLLEHPERIFSTCRLGVELCLVGGSAWVLTIVWERWGWGWGIVASLGFLCAFLALGDVLPQALVAKKPSPWIAGMTWAVTLGRWILFPWILMERACLSLGTGDLERAGHGEPPLVTRQELSWLIRGEEKEREILRDERQMIGRIFRFSESQVREVMIPLVEVCAVEETATVAEVIRKVQEEGYSRFPVYRERIDHILGVLRSFDLLESSPEEPASSFVRKAPFVPEVMPVDELMLQLQRDGHHMAIVVDEYGGSVGIVTMEDLLEEIVGEIQDEYDIQEIHYRKLSAHQFLASARMDIHEANERLGLQIPKGDYETLGGFLLKVFRRIPKEGESLVWGEAQFTVQKADERSVQEVLVTLSRKGEPKESGRP
jgi:CBS domain containing-hemolysin-like protein